MKKITLGFALCALAFACKTDDTASVSDPSGANIPSAECCATEECATECSGKEAAECSGEKKVCPVTGAVED